MAACLRSLSGFPFLFGGTFIEGKPAPAFSRWTRPFPFLFGGTFIEGRVDSVSCSRVADFPSFSEGLSLRVFAAASSRPAKRISLPFRRDFH